MFSHLFFKLQVMFVNDSGLPEAGIDAGGVFKEFLSSLVERAFDANFGLFLRNPAAQLYPNPDSSAVVPNDSKLFEFVGSVLGKAVFEGIQVCPIACIAFTNEWSSLTIRPVLNRTPTCEKYCSSFAHTGRHSPRSIFYRQATRPQELF